jgi:steroid 5-alpha reductase family enzyme
MNDCSYSIGWNVMDTVATTLFLVFVLIESIADNQQYIFQQTKHKLRKESQPLRGEYADGFKQSGLFRLVRKPNYAAEQAIWVSYYLFTISATLGGAPGGDGGSSIPAVFNWSATGWMLLVLLFQGSGYFTEIDHGIEISQIPTVHADHTVVCPQSMDYACS